MVDPPEVPWRRLGQQQLFVRRIEDSSRRMRGMNPPEAKRVIRRLVVCASTILLTFSSIMHTVVIKPVGGSNEEERLVADGRWGWRQMVLFWRQQDTQDTGQAMRHKTQITRSRSDNIVQ